MLLLIKSSVSHDVHEMKTVSPGQPRSISDDVGVDILFTVEDTSQISAKEIQWGVSDQAFG